MGFYELRGGGVSNNNDDRPIFLLHIIKNFILKKDLPKYDINNSNDKGENRELKRAHTFS